MKAKRPQSTPNPLSRPAIALALGGLAVAAIAHLPPAPSEGFTAGNMCLGDLKSSVCLENGWQHLNANGAWDESLLTAGVDPARLETIDRLYQSVLGRRADTEGLKTYSRALARGWSLSRVRRDLAASPEAEQALDKIYRDLLARQVDPEGLATYRDKLEDGWAIHRVRLDVATSPEARSRRRASVAS